MTRLRLTKYISANKFLIVKLGLRVFLHELLNWSMSLIINRVFKQLIKVFLILRDKMNLCTNLLNPVSGFAILVFWTQNFKSAFSSNDTVTEHVDVLEQNFVRNKRAAYQPITEIKAMTFRKTKVNLEEATIIRTSDIFK